MQHFLSKVFDNYSMNHLRSFDRKYCKAAEPLVNNLMKNVTFSEDIVEKKSKINQLLRQMIRKKIKTNAFFLLKEKQVFQNSSANPLFSHLLLAPRKLHSNNKISQRKNFGYVPVFCRTMSLN